MPKPYQLRGITFFLILVGGQPVALSAQDPHPRGCLIRWDAGMQRLGEPCLGSYYDLHGTRMVGPSPGDMDRFPTRLNGTHVEVDVTRVVDGTFRAQRQPDGGYIVGVTPVPTATP